MVDTQYGGEAAGRSMVSCSGVQAAEGETYVPGELAS